MSKCLIWRSGKEAVHRVLDLVEHLEDRVQLGQQQQFDIALVRIHQLQGAALLLERGEADDQDAEPGGIDIVHRAEIHHDVVLPGRGELRNAFPQKVGLA